MGIPCPAGFLLHQREQLICVSSGLKAIVYERFPQDQNRPGLGETTLNIPVIYRVVCLSKTVDSTQCVSAREHRGSQEATILERIIPSDISLSHRQLVLIGPTMFGTELCVEGEECQSFWTLVHHIDLPREPFGLANIVLIVASDERSSRFDDAPVQCIAKAAIWLLHKSNAVILERPYDITRIVLATIVDRKQFEILEGLRQEGIQCFPEVIGSIINWHDDRDFGRIHVLAAREILESLLPVAPGG